jgi:hippurate hydrolase
MTDSKLCPPDLEQRLVALRHDLHAHPELAFNERRTCERLTQALSQLDLRALATVAETGVVARVAGRDPTAPPVAIRGDLDALPIQEETGADFASTVPGVMHACGHDVHAAWTVGAAHLLVDEPAAGDVVILLQPGEESGQGAPRIIESGALDGVAAIFGGHVDMRWEVGTIVTAGGNVSASADEFVIELTGHGSHAARPHEGNDPIVGAAALITALQTIVSRRVPPGVPAVVTVGTISAGTAPNVIPDRARLTGTFRAATAETRSLLHDEIHRMTEAVADANDLRGHLSVEAGTPPLVNDERSLGWAREAARHLLGRDALTTLPVPNLGGEDFAFYLERMPGCFVRIGARRPDQDPIPAHTSRFLPADATVSVGAAVLAETARRASAALNAER